MPRRPILTAIEREGLLVLPDNQDDLIRHYTFSEHDLSIIRLRRGDTNRLGFAIQLCYMRYPGIIFGNRKRPFGPLLDMVSRQLGIGADHWVKYGRREPTRRQHLTEIKSIFGFKTFGAPHHPKVIQLLDDLANQTDKGIVLATAMVNFLRSHSVLLPTINTIESICAGSITKGTKKMYQALISPLTAAHLGRLDELLTGHAESNISTLIWLRQSPAANNACHLLEHIDRLNTIKALNLPADLEKQVHQNRLLKLAREGGQMTPQHFSDLEKVRRRATLLAVILESKATLIDEIVDIHDRIIGSLHSRAKSAHSKEFQRTGKEINDKLRMYCRIGNILLEAKETGEDPFSAIESVISWDEFSESITAAQRLSQSENFDYLHLIGNYYSQVRRYAPALLEALELKAAPAAREILKAVSMLKNMNAKNIRKLPMDAPFGFVRKRWRELVFKEDGFDRKYYELCMFSELKNALRSGDVWVKGSRQFKDFEEYLLPVDKFKALKKEGTIPLQVNTDIKEYLNDRISLLENQLETANRLAEHNQLPEVTISEKGVKISPLINSVPKEADSLTRQAYRLLPRIKITELLMEVDSWTGFTNHFTHIRNGEVAPNKTALMTAILSDAINLGLTKMAQACPGTTYAKLSWLQAWHIRDDTYRTALAQLVNAQLKQPFAAHWGDGTTSSSDGQQFKVGGHAGREGNVNPKYGSEPGIQFYTHVSDQYAPFHTKVINVGVRDATYVLDGLLYHESDLSIEEHYTDTSGFTDHVFALMHLLGFRFAPRIRDIADTKLYVPSSSKSIPALSALIGGTIDINRIRANWDEILRLATSIQQGVVTASLITRKIGSYPRQNGLAAALRELGRIERSIFMLSWFMDPALRQRVTAGLNKGEARNALARAVCFNRSGEIRDRSFESQRFRASGLTLVTGAIALWNTVYLERAINSMKKHGKQTDEALLKHLSPLGWEHINLTGDYNWPQSRKIAKGKFRALRPFKNP